MSDLFEKFNKSMGPLGKWASIAEGYFVFPKLEGKISNRMKFNGKEVITWSVNDYLGLSNHPEVRKIDSEAAEKYGSAYPMGARMMSGHTSMHEKLENQLADFVEKESAHCAREIACKEGLFVGYTSGACLQALKQLNKNNIFESDSVVVSIFCDHGSRYMSKIYSDEWMEEQGFSINRTKEQFSSIEYIQ